MMSTQGCGNKQDLSVYEQVEENVLLENALQLDKQAKASKNASTKEKTNVNSEGKKEKENKSINNEANDSKSGYADGI